MRTKKKDYLFVLIMLFMAGYALGQTEIKAAGILLIPTAGKAKTYKGVITFTQAGIEIECQEKIFQRFNEFDTPRQRKLTITPADLYEIEILKNQRVLLFPRWFFRQQYRNLFIRIVRRFNGFMGEVPEHVLIFDLNDAGAIDDEGKKLIEFLNQRIDEAGKS